MFYVLLQGLYPESHGIIDNVFYDPNFKSLFTIGSAGSYNGSWWGGEPIWNTLSRQASLIGKQSCSAPPEWRCALRGYQPSVSFWWLYWSKVSTASVCVMPTIHAPLHCFHKLSLWSSFLLPAWWVHLWHSPPQVLLVLIRNYAYVSH